MAFLCADIGYRDAQRVELLQPLRHGLGEGVRVAASPSAESIAASILLAASQSAWLPWRRPSQSNSIAADRISEVGLARSWPAMSGAEPCCACATHKSSPALVEPASPRLPESSDASSER